MQCSTFEEAPHSHDMLFHHHYPLISQVLITCTCLLSAHTVNKDQYKSTHLTHSLCQASSIQTHTCFIKSCDFPVNSFVILQECSQILQQSPLLFFSILSCTLMISIISSCNQIQIFTHSAYQLSIRGLCSPRSSYPVLPSSLCSW